MSLTLQYYQDKKKVELVPAAKIVFIDNIWQFKYFAGQKDKFSKRIKIREEKKYGKKLILHFRITNIKICDG